MRASGDHADGGAVAVQLPEQFHDSLAVFGIQVAGGLIGQQDGGLAHLGAGRCRAADLLGISMGFLPSSLRNFIADRQFAFIPLLLFVLTFGVMIS